VISSGIHSNNNGFIGVGDMMEPWCHHQTWRLGNPGTQWSFLAGKIVNGEFSKFIHKCPQNDLGIKDR